VPHRIRSAAAKPAARLAPGDAGHAPGDAGEIPWPQVPTRDGCRSRRSSYGSKTKANNHDRFKEPGRRPTAWSSGGRPAFSGRGPLSTEEFERIFSRVPRLTVELVIVAGDRGVLLALRDFGPCKGLWHLPGGTVRFGEPLVDAVRRVAQDELGVPARARELLGYIEYPSHYTNGLDCPIGLAFLTDVVGGIPDERDLRCECAWSALLPDNMHVEQKTFLVDHVRGLRAQRTASDGTGLNSRVPEGRTKPAPETQARARPANHRFQTNTRRPI